jgi:tetratricopeptide (TPR) repeat protein
MLYLSKKVCYTCVYLMKGGIPMSQSTQTVQSTDVQRMFTRIRFLLTQKERELALALLETISVSVNDEQQRKELDYLLGWAYVLHRRWDDATRVLPIRKMYSEVNRDFESLNDRERFVLCLLCLSDTAIKASHFEEASLHLTRSLKVLQDRRVQLPMAKIKTKYYLATTCVMRGLTAAAIQNYEEALRLCLFVDDYEEIAHIYNGLSDAYRRSGNLMNAHLAGMEALKLYERTGDTHMQGNMHNRLGRISFKLGYYNEASDHYTEALVFATTEGSNTLVMMNCAALADLRLAQGRIDEAKRYCQRAEELSNRTNDDYLSGLTYLIAGKVAQAEAEHTTERKQELLEEAISWYSRAKEKLENKEAYDDIAEMYGRWAEASEELGHSEEAISCWRSAYAVLSTAKGTSWY